MEYPHFATLSTMTADDWKAINDALRAAAAQYETAARADVKRTAETITTNDAATLANQLMYLRTATTKAEEQEERASHARRLAAYLEPLTAAV